MKIEGQTIVLEAGEEVTIKAVSNEAVQTTPNNEAVQTTPTPPNSGGETDTPKADGRMGFAEMIGRFNEVLTRRGYLSVMRGKHVWAYLEWATGYAGRLYDAAEKDPEAWMFRKECYPLIYDYRGTDATDDGTAYNAMQAWLVASALAELVPDAGETTNTQTELFKLAYEIGGGRSYPLYNQKTLKADPHAMRLAGSVMYAVCRGDGDIASQIDEYRQELGGREIPASAWDGLGFKDTELTDGEGRRGYRVDYLGYCINTREFLPDAPGPMVGGTTVTELPLPYEQGQPTELFTLSTQNYTTDEIINNEMIKNWQMMSATPLAVWQSYPLWKQNRLVNVAAVPPCSREYMFGPVRPVRFDGIIRKSYDGKVTADYFCFSQTLEETGLALDGPFSDLAGIRNSHDGTLSDLTDIFDNMRFPTQSPNYGRSRPGCKVSRRAEERNATHGAAENEIYNVDLTTMVADDAQHRAKLSVQDGFAADSPRSYVSGHSSQIWGLALLLCQMNNEGRCEAWIRKAFEYSVNRSIGRFHWMSDVIYGRLFGAMSLPIVMAMSGLKGRLSAMREFVLNPSSDEPEPSPVPQGNWGAHVIVRNMTGANIASTGEVRLYVEGHVGINVYTPNAVGVGTACVFPAGGEFEYDSQCVGNGFDIDDSYDGKAITEARFYDSRHWNSEDCGYRVTLDTADWRCSSAVRKAGATYVLRIEQ